MGNLTWRPGGRSEPGGVEPFRRIAKRLFWKLLELTDPEIMAELVSRVEVQMTRREMEALHYLADGMTSNDIGKVLDISSPHGPTGTMNGIQEKLKAKNRHHVVAIAFRLGLIS